MDSSSACENNDQILLGQELKILQRSEENFTHRVDTDYKIKRITSWRRSSAKFKISLIFNILTFGIIHIISIFKPKLFIKLYCNKSHPTSSDYFLIEDIYGYYTLCKRIYNNRKNIGKKSNSSFVEYTSFSNLNTDKKCLLFEYNNIRYEYDEQLKMLTPIFFNLNKKSIKNIINVYGDGLSTENKVKSKLEKYGKNILKTKFDLPSICLWRVDKYNFLMSLCSGLLLIITKEYIFGIGLIIMLSLLIAVTVTHKFTKFYNAIPTNYTILNNSDNAKYKVKRIYLNKDYELINCSEILPGDVLYLEEEEVVPCDAIILSGDCILDESYTLGKIGNLRKIAIENNSNIFNYQENKINIIFQGTKILKIQSKDENKQKKLVVLCINTGSNTYIANNFLNLVYIVEKNKEYLDIYKFFGGVKLLFNGVIHIIFLTCSISIIAMHYSNKKKHSSNEQIFGIYTYIIKMFAISLMPLFQLTSCFIKYINEKILEKNGIQCVDESRLGEASRVNTVIFDKNGTLSGNKIELCLFFPVYKNEKTSKLFFKSYNKNNSININSELLRYYKNYISNTTDRNSILYKNNSQFFERNSKITNQDYSEELQELHNKSFFINDKIYNECKLCTHFLECLICCNNVDKNNNNELSGNILEQEIFKTFKWDIKYSILKENEKEKINSYFKENKTPNSICHLSNDFFDINEKLLNAFEIENDKIPEIFPIQYYKITEDIENNDKKINNKFITYKLKILKKFSLNNVFELAVITYNCLDKSYKFMIKSTPEKIIGNCIEKSIPTFLNKLLYHYRKQGYRISTFAYKELQKEDKENIYKKLMEKKNDDEFMKDLMNNLIFCGFINFRNQLKYSTKIIVPTLKKMKCDIIMSTGDNLDNSLGVGMSTGILNEKNIFDFCLDENGKILITNIAKSNNDFILRNQTINKNSDNYLYSYKNSNIYRKNNNIIDEYNHNYPLYTPQINCPKFPKRSKNQIHKNKIMSEKFLLDPTDKKNEKNSFLKNSNNELFSEQKMNIKNAKSRNYKESTKNMRKIKLNDSIGSKGKISKLKNEEEINNKVNKFSPEDKEDNKSDILLNYLEENNKETKKALENDSSKIKKKKRGSTISTKSSAKNRNKNLKKILTTSSIELNEKYNFEKGNTTNKDTFANKTSTTKFNSYYASSLFSYYYKEENLHDLKHFSNICINGNTFRYVYNEYKKNKKYIKLMKYLKYKCKIYHSMSTNDKKLLIDFYRSFPDRKVCMVGDGFNDIPAIMTANVGINIMNHKNLNTILCHFFSYNDDLTCVEKILKNGRGVIENYILLLDSIAIFIVLEMSLTFFCFYYQTNLDSAKLLFFNFVVSLLCITAFSKETNIEINYNYLISNKKVFLKYNTIRLLTLLFIKLAELQIINNKSKPSRFVEEKNKDKIRISYIYLACFYFTLSGIFAFNMQSYYRKSIVNNKIFIFFFALSFGYLSFAICLSEKNFSLIIFGLFDFEYVDNNSDTYDDGTKLWTLGIILTDFILSLLLTNFIKCIFDRKYLYDVDDNQLPKEKKE